MRKDPVKQGGDGLLANLRYRQKWKRITSVLSVFVAVGTISALMLPAITMNQPACGLEAHTHGENCYAVSTETALLCSYETLGIHAHGPECLDEEGNLLCQVPDFLVHTHDELCWDAGENLVCGLKEAVAHSHEDGCYQATEVVAEEGHAHGDECYAWGISETPTCGMEESEGHAHGAGCFAAERTLVCAEEEREGHSHGEACYETAAVLGCGLEEAAGHSHAEGCYGEDGNLLCQEAEQEGHAHEDGCYTQEQKLTCAEPEEEGHTHGEGCWVEAGGLLCLIPESQGHSHAESCCGPVKGELLCTQEEKAPVMAPGEPELLCQEPEIRLHTHEENCFTPDSEAQEPVLTCTQPEILAHQHGESCFGEREVRTLTCELTEHSHTGECFPAEELPEYACGLEEHTHDESCLDEEGNLTCALPEHSHGDACRLPALTEEEKAAVEALDALLEPLPTSEEAQARQKELEEAGDGEALDAYMSGLYTQVGEAKAVFDTLTDDQKLHLKNGEKLETLVTMFFPETMTLEIPDADLAVDFYVYNAIEQEWELVAENEMLAHYSENSSYRDYITIKDLNAILGPYGFDPDAANVERTLAYRTNRTDDKFTWFSDTTLNTQVPAEASGEDVFPLSVFAYHKYPKEQGYAIAFLPENTKRVSSISMDTLAKYCGLDKRENGTHTGMTMTLFNYGSKMSTYADKLGFLYGADLDDMKATSMDQVKGNGIGRVPLKMEPTLSPGGWPTGTYGSYTVDTAYLFAPGYDDYTYEQYMQNRSSYVAGTNPTNFARFSVPITGDGGLFYKDGNGYLIYDSAANAATYDGNGGFNVYDHSIAPKHIELMDPEEKSGTARGNGNFLPFNLASQIDPSTYQTLSYDQKPELGYSDTTIENYGLEENTDLWFGMTMEVDFYMPKNGQINGSDMIFDFFGDDDVWVYIDDVLVLDIGGTHGSLGGSINFGTGEVVNPASIAARGETGISGAGCGSSMLDENGNALTNLKDIFDRAGKDTSTFSGDTFGNYTKHKLKFFYMERGGNISYCRLKFNLPTLPANSLTVGKDIEIVDETGAVADVTPEAEYFAKQNLFYTFRVLKADGTPLIKNTGVHLIDDLGHSTGELVQVDENGYFTLKADQKVRFDDMLKYNPEGDYRYYVEESIPTNYTLQYGGISYGDGGLLEGTINQDTKFTTYRTANMKPDESNLVVYTNKVISERMSFLKISKEALPGSDIHGGETFPFRITIGNEIVEAGTEFVDVDNENVVLTANSEGVIWLELGQTVMLNNPIIAGTAFKVEELDSEGWQLDHISGTFSDGTAVSVSADGSMAVDEMPVNTTATVTAYNKTYSFGTAIPLSKQFKGVNSQLSDFARYATFRIEQVSDAAGTALPEDAQRVPGVIPDVTLECRGQEVNSGSITIGYLSTAEKKDYFYRIREESSSAKPGELFINDESVYIVQVTVTEGSAAITAVYKDGAPIGKDATAAFVNTLAIVELPATGGPGIQMYMFSGWAMILTACALMYNAKRKQRKGAR